MTVGGLNRKIVVQKMMIRSTDGEMSSGLGKAGLYWQRCNFRPTLTSVGKECSCEVVGSQKLFFFADLSLLQGITRGFRAPTSVVL